MLVVAIAALLGSAVTCYAIGWAYSAPRDTFLRTKKGVWLLVILGASFVLLPPQLTAIDSLGPSATGSVPGLDVGAVLAWPEGLGKGLYLALWVGTSVLALLGGVRIWQLGSPEWRSGAGRAYDASAVSRITGLLPLADSLAGALGVLAGAHPTPRDIERVAGEVRDLGRKYAAELPGKDGAVYQMVAGVLPAAVAANVTGLLLEGAGRRTSGG